MLQASARRLDTEAVPPQREAAVLAAMQAAGGRRLATPAPRRGWAVRWAGWRPLAWSGAAICGVLLLGATLLLMQEPPTRTLAARNLGSGFLPLVSSERWDSYLHEDGGRRGQAWIVATEMPRERLALLGLPYDPAQAGESVRAELLMHRSGDVLAVRFLR